jgi:hypothetical protein
VNLGNSISNFGGNGSASINSTNFTSGRIAYFNDNAYPFLHSIDAANSSKTLTIDIDTVTRNGTIYQWNDILNPVGVGPTGPTGPAGETGATGSPGTTLVFLGKQWTLDTPYEVNDVVFASDNNTYVCIDATNAGTEDPTTLNTSWVLFANKGPEGPQGDQGQPGPAGTPLNFIGLWIPGSYPVNTLAVDGLDNNTYVSLSQVEFPNDLPPSTLPAYWALFANGGPTGPPATLSTGIIPLDTGTWILDVNSGTYYQDFPLSGVTLNINSIVQVTTINSEPLVASNCWILSVKPNVSGDGSLRIWCAASPTLNDVLFATWLVTEIGIPPP